MKVICKRQSLYEMIQDSDSRRLQEERASIYEMVENEFKVYDPFHSDYVSEVLNESFFRNLKADNPTIIASPTGSGKSTVIKELVYPQVMSRKKRMLIVVPRKALALQYKQLLSKTYSPDILENYTFKGMSSVHTVGYADIFLMQELQQSRYMDYCIQQQENYEYIIIDEIDLFIRDAGFNMFTERILCQLVLQVGKTAKHLYLSATPEVVLDEVYALEQRSKNQNYSRLLETWGSVRQNNSDRILQMIRFTKKYEYVQPVFFHDDKELLVELSQTADTEKVLIFVDTKERGELLKDKLINADFICAETKEKEKADLFQYILEAHSFPKKYLIVTRFLDVGVDLIDVKLNRVVLFAHTREDVLQMLGRKRVKKNEIVTAYIHVPSLQALKNQSNLLARKIREIDMNIEQYKQFGVGMVTDLPIPLYLENIQGGCRVAYNSFTRNFYAYSKKNLDKYVLEMEEHSKQYSDIVLSFLPGCRNHRWAGNDECDSGCSDDADDELKKNLDKPMEEKEYIEWGENMLKLFGIDRRGAQRGNRPTRKLNEFFEKHNMNYFLRNLSPEGKKGQWVLERT